MKAHRDTERQAELCAKEVVIGFHDRTDMAQNRLAVGRDPNRIHIFRTQGRLIPNIVERIESGVDKMAATIGFQAIVEQMPGLAETIGQSTKVILPANTLQKPFSPSRIV